jgi:putative spermidine/putrescine transport system ATP-binding protein
LKELHRQLGVTFVYVTHDQGEALTMSDRVAVFNDGLIQQIDAVERLYETPDNRFVAGFVGDSTLLNGPARRPRRCSWCCPRPLDRRERECSRGAAVEVRRAHRRTAGAEPATCCGRGDGVIYFGDHLRLLAHRGAQAKPPAALSVHAAAGTACG